MRKINALICGIASLFSVTSAINVDEIIEKYPTPNETSSSRITKSWEKVGKALQGAIDEFEKTEKHS